MGLRDDSRDPIVVRDVDPRLVENLTLVEKVKRLEREREADRAAIRALSNKAYLVLLDDVAGLADVPSTEWEDIAADTPEYHLKKAMEEHAAAIQRAQDARAGEGRN